MGENETDKDMEFKKIEAKSIPHSWGPKSKTITKYEGP